MGSAGYGPPVNDPYRHWDGARWHVWNGAQWVPEGAVSPYPATVYVQGPQTSGQAIASLVLSILWIWGLGSIAAIILGHVARNQVRRRERTGDGMAVAGIIIGWVGLAGAVLFIVLFIALVNDVHTTFNNCDTVTC